MQAMADPSALTPAQKFANYAAVASAGAGVLSAISSASMGGRYSGGPVSAGGLYRVGERGKPEILQQGGKNYLLPGDKSGNVLSNSEISGSGGSTITQNISFNIQTTGGIDDATMNDLTKRMETVSRMTIKNEQRPNGLLQKSR